MRLVELTIHRLPGIRPGFTLRDLDPGINILTGPNASGKSSVMRAVQALLFDSELRGEGVYLEGVFDDDGTRLSATRLGDSIHWTTGGAAMEPPPLPDRRFLGCYTLRLEDLAGTGDADDEIAKRIARDLSGGYDLSAVRESEAFRPRPQRGANEQKRLQRASDELRAAERQRADLYRHEQQLAELQVRKEAAERAAGEVADVGEALALLEVRGKQRENRLTAELLPAGLDLLHGNELERLETVRSTVDELEGELRAAGLELANAQGDLQGSGLAEAALAGGDIREAKAQLQELLALESEAGQHARERARAEQALRAAEAQLGSSAAGREAGQAPRIDPETLREVEGRLAGKRELDAESRRLQSELAGLPAGPEAGPGLEALRSGRHELLAWLSSAGAARWGGRRVVGLFLALLSFGGAVAAVLLAAELLGDELYALIPERLASLAPENDLALLAVLLLSLLFLLGLVLMQRPSRAERGRARSAFERLGLPAPESWREEAVRGRLDELSQAIAEREQDDILGQRRDRVDRELAAVTERLAALDDELAQLALEVGFDPLLLDASFERWLRLVGNYDSARRGIDESEAELQLLSERMAGLRDPLREFLTRHGEAPQVGEAGLGGLQARLDTLEGRLAARDGARARIAEAERKLERLGSDLEAKRREVDELFASVGLAGPAGAEAELELRRRLEHLGEWNELVEEGLNLAADERLRAGRLTGRDDLLGLVEAGDRQRLEAELAGAREQSELRDDYANRITEIATRIRSAESERKLEGLRAARQQAEDELGLRYEEALFAEAGTFLLDGVEQEHVAASRPETLRRAEEWFRLFTRHRYELRFDGGADPGFRAWETASGEVRGISELSAGTKAQLLLAVRVAFALHAEQGRRSLPLFLDEALTTADPDRFRAIAHSLRTLADAGRQVFYLTARAHDTLFWHQEDGTPPATVDVALLRGQAQAVPDVALLELPERTPLPPAGLATAEEYARRLAVPPVDPWTSPDAVHVFHLTRHDLELLHGLLDAGADRLGTLRSFLRSGAAGLRVTDAERRELELRCRAVEAWFEGWRVGRGRPIDRRSLEDSRAVTATFIDRVDELARSLDGDAKRLLARLESGAVERFRESNREQLGEWLLDNGYLDERETLTPQELRHQVAAALVREGGDDVAGEEIDLLELAHAVADCLQAGLNAGSALLADR